MEHVQSSIDCDLLIVGGGINGAGIARDAAGRGLSVVLCEKDDLASHTSSASTKLIHGGLRYLEYYEFNLVRKALIEREVLLQSAPHIMWPMRFVMPHDKGLRPSWMIRIGLFLYDILGKREILPGSRSVDLRKHPAGEPLKPAYTHRGYIYSDGWVDDARLVVLNAVDAAAKGARVLTRTTCLSAERTADRWIARLRNEQGEMTVRARSMVNAAGPWTAHFLQTAARQPSTKSLRLIKGSHIVVPRLFEHPYSYIFQHPDGRIVFAIPYEQNFTLIGTTDIDYQGDVDKVAIDQEEISYLCTLTSRYFNKEITPADVVWTYSGVRPLVEDEAASASAVTRDYRLELDRQNAQGAQSAQGTQDAQGAPLLSVFGGKITTFRKLAEEAVDMLAPILNVTTPSWTADACLPGGDLFGKKPNTRGVREFDQFVSGLQITYPWLPAAMARRFGRAYGTLTHRLLEGRNSLIAMGEEIAPGLFEAEVDYLMRNEWAVTAQDILWRRSKLGLHLPRDTETKLDAWISGRKAVRMAATQ
jgi:glycerol-3-phosphate dehydrogenase